MMKIVADLNGRTSEGYLPVRTRERLEVGQQVAIVDEDDPLLVGSGVVAWVDGERGLADIDVAWDSFRNLVDFLTETTNQVHIAALALETKSPNTFVHAWVRQAERGATVGWAADQTEVQPV